ncbi:MAG: hypothetical protein GY753_04125, partial [Gammaproteobacteria bacterium]|nr:hypothetical protein [Gammaproteobacteria bacterium]
GSFLYYMNPDLDTMDTNFSDPGASSPYAPTWGIDPTTMHVQVDHFTHLDEALVTTTQTNTVALLDSLSTSSPDGVECTVNTTGQYTPTIAMAYQDTRGSMDLSSSKMTIANGSEEVVSSKSVAFTAKLAEMPVFTLRQVQLNSYACEIGDDGAAAWAALSSNGALDEVSRRYPNQSQHRWMGMVQQVFVAYYSGRSNIMSVNGKLSGWVGETAPADAFSGFVDETSFSMPDYVRKVYLLDSLYVDIDTMGMGSALSVWARDMNEVGVYAGLGLELKLGMQLMGKIMGSIGSGLKSLFSSGSGMADAGAKNMTESELAALEETNPEEFKNLSNLAKEGLIIIDP